jgi:hypothetical protein
VTDSVIHTLVHCKLGDEARPTSEHPACDLTVCCQVRAESEEIVEHRLYKNNRLCSRYELTQKQQLSIEYAIKQCVSSYEIMLKK